MRALPIALASVALVVALIALFSSDKEERRFGSGPSTEEALLAERLDSLEQKIRDLRAEFTALEIAATPNTIGSPSALPLEARLSAIEEALEPALARGLGPSKRELEEAVTQEELDRTRRAIAAVRREELGVKLEGWIAKEQARSTSVLDAIEQKLSLPPSTMQRVRDLFAEETEAHASILDEMWSREPPQTRAEEEAIATDWDTATIEMKTVRRDRDAALEELLGEEQFQELQTVVNSVERWGGKQ